MTGVKLTNPTTTIEISRFNKLEKELQSLHERVQLLEQFNIQLNKTSLNNVNPNHNK